MTERHIIKVAVQVKLAKLLVRFPCKLTFQLKTDSAQTDSRHAYQLKKGQCIVNEVLEAEAQLNYDPLTSQYQDKKVRIFVQMASANGVIPAGNVTFNPCNKEPQEQVQYTLALQKCPDRSAQISFIQSFHFQRKVASQNIYQSQAANREPKLSKVDLKYSSASHAILQSQFKSPRDKSNNNSKYVRVSPNNYRQGSPKNQRIKTANYPSFRPQHSEQYDEYGESQVMQEEGYQRYNSRYVDPSEKVHYVKEIARLKGQVKSLQSDERWDQLIRVKEENQQVTNDLEKARQRIRMNQRRERQMNMQLKEVKEEVDRTKSKFLQSQSLKNQGEVIISDRDRTIKDLQLEIKRLEEKIQDVNAQLSNQVKRVEFKQNSYQEQLRKINEKYTQSEGERQKVTFDYNTLLAKLQEAEKKHQTAAKEKQRGFVEERNRLNKKIDGLSQTIEKMRQEQNDRESQLNQNILQVKSLTKRESEREEKLGSVQSELQLCRMQLKKQLDQRKLYEQQISAYKIIEDERNSLRKKYNELTTEQARISEKLERSSNQLSLAEQRIRELDHNLQQRTRQRDASNAKVNSLKKEVSVLTKEDERLTKQNESLTAQSFNSNQKINDLKSKLQTQKNDTEDMKNYYEEQLAYISKSKQYSDHEIEELKWQIQKMQQQCNQLNARFKNSNNQILNLNEAVLVSNQRTKRAEEENKQLNSQVDSLKKQVAEWERKERNLNEQLKSKVEIVYELTKKVQSLEGQLFIAQQKMKQVEINSDERRSSDEKLLREKDKHLSQKGEEMTSLQLELMTVKQELSSVSQELAIRVNQINYIKESLQNSKQDLGNREIKMEQTREELKLSQQQNQTLSKDSEKLARGWQEEKATNVKLKRQWEDYRRETTSALEQLLQEISKGDDEVSLAKHNLLTFPDETLSAMQVEAVKKRNSIIGKYQLKVLELSEENVVLESQIQKLSLQQGDKQQQFDQHIKQDKQKLKQVSAQAQFEQEQLQKKIEELQEGNLELSGQIEKLGNQVKQKEQQIQQQKEEIRINQDEIQSLRNDIKLAEEKILGLKSNEIKWKSSNQNKFSQFTDQNQSVLERYKVNVTELEKKVVAFEKVLREKEQIIKKSQAKVNELTYQKERSEVKVIEIHEKWVLDSDDKKQLQKRIRTLQKEHKQLNQQLSSAKQSLGNEQIKFQEVQSKLTQAHSGFTDSQVNAEKLKAELDIARDSISLLEDTLRQKGDKSKAFSEKSSLEVKQLKEKIITLTSSIQLKEFQITQQEDQMSSLKENVTDLKQELTKKKTQNIKLADKVQELKNQEMYNSQNIQILKSQKEFLQEECDRLKERVIGLEEDLTQAQLFVQTADIKEKELNKLREEMDAIKFERDRATNELRVSIANPKSNLATSRIGGHDEKKRTRELQQLLEAKHVDLAIQRKKLLNQFQREKRVLVGEIAALRQEVENLQGQFDFQRAQLNKEIESLNDQTEQLTTELNEKNEALLAQQQLLQAVKNQQNSEHIQDCLNNIKTIFARSERGRDERQLPVESMTVHQEEYGQQQQGQQKQGQ